MKKFKRNVLAASTFFVGACCLLCGVAVLPTAASATTTATTIDGYKAVFQDDFENNQLKEGWFDVSGTLSASDGEWDFGDNTGSIVWGDGTQTDSGKMLYDVGKTEYMVSADITFARGTQDVDAINMHMPLIVTESGDYNAFTGVSINFRPNYAVLYDMDASASIKRTDDVGSKAVIVLYEAIPTYNADTWDTTAHTWSAIVKADTIELYVDGYYMVSGARPDYTKSATVCGICGNSTSGSNYKTIKYDNFTVWTEGKIEEEADTELYDYDIDKLFTAGRYTQNGKEDYSSYIPYDSTTNTATVNVGAAYESRLITDMDVSDFTLTFTISKGSDFIYFSDNNGILFRATYSDTTVSGYYFTFSLSKTGEVLANIRKLEKAAYSATGSAEDLSFNEGGSYFDSFAFDEKITLSAIGNTISLSCGGATKTITDSTYTSGSIGLKTRAVSNITGGYSIQFNEFKTDYKAPTLVAYNPNLLFSTSNGFVQNGTSYSDYITYSNSVATIGEGATWENRLLSNLQASDFSLTLTIDSENTYGISTNNAIVFRSYFKNSLAYGYAMTFGTTTKETKTLTGRIWRMDGKAKTAAFTTTNAVAVGDTFTLTLGQAITIEAEGSTFCITTGDTTVTRTDSTYASGSIGIFTRVQEASTTNRSTTSYTVAFGSLKYAQEGVDAEDASKTLGNLTATDVVSGEKNIYSVRNDAEITADDLADNVIGFVRDGKVYYQNDSSATSVNVLTLSDYAVKGATVRVTSPTGLRFKTTISQADYENVTTTYALTTSYGTLLLPTEQLSGKLTLDNETALNITHSDLKPSASSNYSFLAAVTNIPKANYGTYVTARSYITFTLSDGTRTVYTEEMSRSVRQVAMLALEDEEESYSEEVLSTLRTFAGVVDTSALTFEKVKTATATGVYPRIVELSDGTPYLFANTKYATYSNGAFGAYTTVLKQNVSYTLNGAEYTLVQDNGQPFVLADGRVVVTYRAYDLKETTTTAATGYSSIRMVIGDKNGKNFGDPIIIAENVSTDGYFFGMWEPYIVQSGSELWIYFSCDINTSTDEDSAYISGGSTSQSILLAKYDLDTEKVTGTSTMLDGTTVNNRYGMSVIPKLADGSYIMVIEGNENLTNFEIMVSYSQDGVSNWSTPVTVFEATDGNCGAPYVDVLPTGQIVITYQSDYDKSSFEITNGDYVRQSRLKVWVSDAVVTNGMAVADMKLVDVTEKLGLKYGTNDYLIWNSVSVVGTKLYVMGGRGANVTTDDGTTSSDSSVEVYMAELA